MKALILAAGDGKALLPFTATRPATMIRVGERPIIENTLKMLKETGVNTVYIAVGYQNKIIEDHLLDGSDFGLSIHYLYQNKHPGVGGAIALIKEKINPGEYFLLLYADIIAQGNIVHSIIQSFNSAKASVASICLTQSTGMFGNVYFNNEMGITKILEKPKKQHLGNYVLSGLFILPEEFISLLEKNKFDMIKSLSKLIKKDGLTASIWENDWLDVRYPWDILNANKMMMGNWSYANVSASVNLKGNVQITGPVHIEEGVAIRSGAVIEGPCFIGKNSFIGNNVLVRKNSSIGSNSIIGYGVELKNCILFGHSRIGRLSFIGDSVIGSNVEIGSGTMTINSNLDRSTIKSTVNGKKMDSGLEKLGAFIGDNAEIGSGHTLRAGVSISKMARIPHHYTYPAKK